MYVTLQRVHLKLVMIMMQSGMSRDVIKGRLFRLTHGLDNRHFVKDRSRHQLPRNLGDLDRHRNLTQADRTRRGLVTVSIPRALRGQLGNLELEAYELVKEGSFGQRLDTLGTGTLGFAAGTFCFGFHRKCSWLVRLRCARRINLILCRPVKVRHLVTGPNVVSTGRVDLHLKRNGHVIGQNTLLHPAVRVTRTNIVYNGDTVHQPIRVHWRVQRMHTTGLSVHDEVIGIINQVLPSISGTLNSRILNDLKRRLRRSLDALVQLNLKVPVQFQLGSDTRRVQVRVVQGAKLLCVHLMIGQVRQLGRDNEDAQMSRQGGTRSRRGNG